MILVTGATGFVGRPTLGALLRRSPDTAVRVAMHRRHIVDDLGGGVQQLQADLADPASLTGLCDGVHTVVHLASAISEDEETCMTVNARGTEALVAEARRAGVRRIVYLSTAAVYGAGAHRGIIEDEVAPEPVSPTSRSRLLAEGSILAAGGAVLRPMFVYGPGDTWFVPSLARTLSRTPVTIEGGRARLSLVAVQDLADVIAALALAPERANVGGVHHANHPDPVSMRDLVDALVEHLGVARPTADLSYEDATAFVGDDPTLTRQLDLVALDHFYASSRIWRLTRVTPHAFREQFAAAAPWYRAHLDAAPASAR